MNQLVMREGEELFTTSEVIAANAGVQHKNTLELIERNLEDLWEFGLVAFETRARLAGQHGGGSTRYAKLNEQQAMLILTYLKNTDRVRAFKKALVRAFFEMAKQLQAPVARSSDEIIAAGLLEAHKVLAQRDRALAVAVPKAEAYDEFIDSEGLYTIGNVGKAIGIGPVLIFTELHKAKVLMHAGSRRNIPYQQYMKYFEVKAQTYRGPDGKKTATSTTYVKPAGIDFIRRKLNLTGPAAQVSLSK